MTSFSTATALAAVLLALPAAATDGPVQLAQMNVAPKIQPAPPPNLARPPVITPRIDASRLAGERDDGGADDGGKDTTANPEQVPQQAATGGQAPRIARQSAPPPAAALTRAPLPQARPGLFGGLDPNDLLDARGAAEAREAAEAAAMAGVGVEPSDLSGLGDPMTGDQGGGPPDPKVGGMSPDEFKERFGLGWMQSPEDIAAGMATEFNDLGNRGTNSPAGDFAAGFRPDPSTIPRGDLASNRGWDTVYLRPTFFPQQTVDSGWITYGDDEIRTLTTLTAGNITVRTRQLVIHGNGDKSETMVEYDANGNETYRHHERRDKDGNLIEREETGTPRDAGEGAAELHTPESAPGGIGGCAPSDGSAACQEFRRLMREGNSPGRMIAGGTRVNPGDPDDGTGSGPRLILSPDDLLGNPDPNSWGRGGTGRGARSFDGGTLVNDEGGGTGPGLGQ